MSRTGFIIYCSTSACSASLNVNIHGYIALDFGKQRSQFPFSIINQATSSPLPILPDINQALCRPRRGAPEVSYLVRLLYVSPALLLPPLSLLYLMYAWYADASLRRQRYPCHYRCASHLYHPTIVLRPFIYRNTLCTLHCTANHTTRGSNVHNTQWETGPHHNRNHHGGK